MTRRVFYVFASPLIFLGNIAAAIGEAVRAFPREFLAGWRSFGRPVGTNGVPEVCAPCGGSGFEQHLQDLDGDPACRLCGGSGSADEAMRRAVEAMERRKRGLA